MNQMLYKKGVLSLLTLLLFLGTSVGTLAYANCSVTITGPTFRCGSGGVGLTSVPVNTQGNVTYAWSTGSTSPNLHAFVSQTTTFTLTITDATGCTATASHTVTVNAPMTPVTVSVSPAGPYCLGQQTTVTASHSGANGPFTYLWSNGSPSQPVVTYEVVNGGGHPPTGNISVTVTNAQGCSWATPSTFFTVTPFFPTIVSDSTLPRCEGQLLNLRATTQSNWTITQYAWSTGETTPQIIVGASGNYQLTITNQNGCTAARSFNVPGFKPNPEFELTGPEYLCPGKKGRIFVDYKGNTPLYLWNPTLPNVPNPEIDAAGTYTLTLLATNGCSTTKSIDVKPGSTPAVDIAGIPAVCANEQAPRTLSVNSPATLTDYRWNTGEETAEINVDQPGTYAVTVTNNQGCTGVDNQLVIDGSAFSVNISGVSTMCLGDTVPLSVVQSFNQYEWSSGGTTRQINALEPGDYFVTVTNQFGCTGTAKYTVQAKSLGLTLSQSGPICPGDTARLTASGNNIVSYKWSNGENKPQTAVTRPGTYQVTVSDNLGCGAKGIVSVPSKAVDNNKIQMLPYACDGRMTLRIRPDSLSAFAWSTGDTLQNLSVNQSGNYAVRITSKDGCISGDTAALNVPVWQAVAIERQGAFCENNPATPVSLSATPGFARYAWSTGDTLAGISTVQPGAYTVEAWDTLGCVSTATVQLAASSMPDVSLDALPYACDATRTLQVGNDVFAAYTWSNGYQTPSVTVNASGDYSVTVSNTDGCTQTASITVDVPSLPEVAIAGAGALCPGESTVLNATPGFSAYTWSNGEQTENIQVGSAGAYTVVATDNNGCTAEATQTVDVLPLDPIIVRGARNICKGGGTTFTVFGNWTSIRWSTGETGPAIDASVAGVYAVTATNAAGCRAETTVELVVGDTLTPSVTMRPYACDGVLTLDAGMGFASYTWSNGVTTTAQAVTASGTYAVTVSDGKGCTGSAALSVTVPEVRTLAFDAPALLCSGTTAELTAGAGFADYQWSDGVAGPSRTISAGGAYTLTATDANGCTDEQTAVVAESTVAQPVILQVGLCDNRVRIMVDGFYSGYAWPDGSTLPFTEAPNNAEYALTLTNADGCASAFVIPVNMATTDAEAPAVACPADQLRCPADNVVVFDTPQATDNCSVASLTLTQGLPSGSAFPTGVTVNTWTARDAAGNQTECSFVVEVAPDADLVLESLTPDLGGTGAGAIDISVIGANAPYNFVWTAGANVVANTEDVSGLPAGMYTVSVFDNSGCLVATETYEVDLLSRTTYLAEDRQVTLTPNPTVGLLNIRFTEAPRQVYDILLIDALGRTALQQFGNAGQELTLDLGRLPAGAYAVVCLAAGKQMWTSKVVKMD